jgi:DNA polymerase III subunit gamma/tau
MFSMRQNLARAWRAKTFDELIGQELSVQLLKNSLAKNALFPVYLLSGLRGSGKTSMGRIFAAAVNCACLPEFQKNPHKVSLPCLHCASCQALYGGQHPDFIEVDAASYTGVDNVRQIIESASFLPVMGNKKVYLIDEAHMLSKAAFNAFLKILEEPPATVLFLLATTESHKILETVKSRSFQLFFEPIPQDVLSAHLKKVCECEEVKYEDAALNVLAQNSEGSARDALTLLERVVLAEDKVSLQGVYRALGLLHDQVLIALFEHIARGELVAVLACMQKEQFDKYNALRIWEKLVACLRALLWQQAGITIDASQAKARAHLLTFYDQQLLIEFLELFHKHEAQFLKTTSQHIFLESLISKMTQRFQGSQKKMVQQGIARDQGRASESVNIVEQEAPLQQEHHKAAIGPQTDLWGTFLQLLEQTGNPVATSIFRQGNFLSIEQNMVRVRFAKKFEFYYEWIFANESLWKFSLEQIFGKNILFVPEFEDGIDGQKVSQSVEKKSRSEVVHLQEPIREKKIAVAKVHHGGNVRYEQPARVLQRRIDVSDEEKWKFANAVLKIFPGTVSVRQE